MLETYVTQKGHNVILSLPQSAVEKILELFNIESDAWHYTCRYFESGSVDEGLMIRGAPDSKYAHKCALFYDEMIRAIKIQRSNTWINGQCCDAELLVELSLQMSEILTNDQYHVEDSRCFHELCVEMAHYFQSKHEKTNWDEADFRSEVMYFSNRVKHKLFKYPNWINSDYRFMYGNETLIDLLKKY